MIQILNHARWTDNSPAIYYDVYYEKYRDGADMMYRVLFRVEPKTSGSFGYNIVVDISLEGQLKATATLKTSGSSWSDNKDYTTDWIRISGKTSGTTALTTRLYSTNGSSRDVTNNFNLDVDPSYANITSCGSESNTETTITHYMVVDNYCSDTYYKYALQNEDGTWAPYTQWYSMGACGANERKTHTITGLLAGRTYKVGWKCKRGDSGLEKEAPYALVIHLYDYPKPTAMNNFHIGNGATVVLKNPLNRQVTMEILQVGTNTLLGTYTGSDNGNINEPYKTQDAINRQYASIPNSTLGYYYAKVTYGSIVKTLDSGKKYEVKSEECIPTFSNFTYEDINPTTLALTGDSQIIIPKYSNVTTTVSVANKAMAKNSATMTSYVFSCGDATPDAQSYSSSEDVEMTINTIPSGTFRVTAYDSRGLGTPIDKTATTIINYTKPVKDVTSTCDRDGSVTEDTKLTLKGSIWYDSFGDVTNSITSATYKYRVLGSTGNYTTGVTDITPTLNNDGTFTFTGLIQGDTNSGFDIANSYEVVVTVSDELESIDYTFTLRGGKPHIAYHKNGVSIMGPYNTSNGGKLQIDGENIINTILSNMYPVGSIYMSVNNTNPSTYFGGTWVAWGSGQVPVGVDTNVTEFNTVEKTGGNLTHLHSTGDCTLTAAQSGLRSHGHGAYSDGAGGHSHTSNGYWRNGSGNEWVMSYSATGSTNNSTNISSVGDHAHTIHVNNEGNWNAEQAHNHGNTGSTSSLQPYITCYMWKRTA